MSIYASGRALRTEVNSAVQSGLKANGELGVEGLRLDTLSHVNLTSEELRFAKANALFGRPNASSCECHFPAFTSGHDDMPRPKGLRGSTVWRGSGKPSRRRGPPSRGGCSL